MKMCAANRDVLVPALSFPAHCGLNTDLTNQPSASPPPHPAHLLIHFLPAAQTAFVHLWAASRKCKYYAMKYDNLSL